MTTRTTSETNDPVIESKADLIGVFARGEKPKAAWRIGTEHEKFVYRTTDHRAPSYDEKGGIHALLIGLTHYGWEPVYEGETIIALSGPDGSVSLEPAGQFELSGAPLEDLHQTCAETGRHLKQVKEVGEMLGLGFLGLGLWPDKTRADLPVMPKGRYKIMLDWRPRCLLTHRFWKGSRTGSCRIEAISGPTPIRTGPACCRSCSTKASDTNAMPIICSTCRCISRSGTADISMRLD